MTQQTRANLKSKFETGDRPTQTDYEDLIDSKLNLADASSQTITSPVEFASNITLTTTLSAQTIHASAIIAESSGTFRDDVDIKGRVSGAQATFTNTVSADEIYASAIVANGVPLGPSSTSFGGISLASAQATTISAAGGYSECFGGTTLDTSANRDFSMPRDFTLRYTGATEKTFHVIAAISVSAGGNNKNTGMRLGKAAGGDSKTEIYRFIPTGANTGAAAVAGLFKLDQNQEISLFVTNTTDTVAVTVHKLNMTAHEV